MSKINLQEKRRIENLIFSEVDYAISTYDDRRKEEYTRLKEKLIENPPEMVLKAREAALKAEEEIDKAGYEIERYGDRSLDIRENGQYQHKDLVKFNDETDAKRRLLEQLKKKHIIMIYADDDEVKTLFDKVGEDIQKVLG